MNIDLKKHAINFFIIKKVFGKKLYCPQDIFFSLFEIDVQGV